MVPVSDLEDLVPFKQIAQFLHSMLFCFSLSAYGSATQEGVGLSEGILKQFFNPSSRFLSFFNLSLYHFCFILAVWVRIGLEREFSSEEFFYSTDVFF